jgi:hypothetical protein
MAFSFFKSSAAASHFFAARFDDTSASSLFASPAGPAAGPGSGSEGSVVGFCPGTGVCVCNTTGGNVEAVEVDGVAGAPVCPADCGSATGGFSSFLQPTTNIPPTINPRIMRGANMRFLPESGKQQNSHSFPYSIQSGQFTHFSQDAKSRPFPSQAFNDPSANLRKDFDQQLEVVDPDNGDVLLSRTDSHFRQGRYPVLRLSGHVILRFTRVGRANATLSGIFFDELPSPAP